MLPDKCEPIERDQYDRIVARCFLGEKDIAAWMVASGHALAYREFSGDYIDEEDVARTMKRGMWQGEFQSPWEWRKQQETWGLICKRPAKGTRSQQDHPQTKSGPTGPLLYSM